MKKIIMLLIAATLSSIAVAQQTITIKGEVKFTDVPEFMVKLLKRDGYTLKTVVEAKVDEKKQYSMAVKVAAPGLYTLDCGRWQTVNVWVEDENLEVNFRGCDTAKIKIKNPPYVHINGGEKNNLMNLHNYDAYRSYQNMIAISQTIYKEKGVADSVKQALSMKFYTNNYNDQTERTKFLVRSFTDVGSVMALLSSVRDKALEDSVVRVIEARDPSYAPLVAHKEAIRQKAEREARTAIGAAAPDFELPTPEGKRLSLTNFKGKLLIIDFWASWCGPCRAEIPSMKKIYEEFKGKGVEFLSVSIDSKEDKWREALAEDQMPWAQVLAPNAGKEICQAYDFSGIPHIILLDKDGKFMARNLRGKGVKEAIQKALAE